MPTWALWKVALRLALILMTLSLLVCRTVQGPDDVASVPFGLPIPFVVLDARANAPSVYPGRLCFGDPRRRPTRLKPLAALADLALLMLVVVVAARALGRGWSPARTTGRTDRR